MKTDDVQFVLGCQWMSVTTSRESEKPLWGQRKALHFFVMWEFCMVEHQIGANRPDIYHPSSTCQVSSEPRKIQRCFRRADRFHGTSTKHYQRGCNISVRNWLQRRLTQDALTQMIENHGKAFTGTELGSEELIMIEDPIWSHAKHEGLPWSSWHRWNAQWEKRGVRHSVQCWKIYRCSFSQKWGFFGWLILFTIEWSFILVSFFHIPLTHTHWKPHAHWQQKGRQGGETESKDEMKDKSS